MRPDFKVIKPLIKGSSPGCTEGLVTKPTCVAGRACGGKKPHRHITRPITSPGEENKHLQLLFAGCINYSRTEREAGKYERGWARGRVAGLRGRRKGAASHPRAPELRPPEDEPAASTAKSAPSSS